MGRPPIEGMADKLIQAALEDMAEHGIIGLRVGAVAERAGTSTTMIYRHFGSRDGLLEAALAQWFDWRVEFGLTNVRSLLDRPGEIRTEDVVAMTPPLNFPGSEELHRFAHRILVVASENEGLRAHVSRLLNRWQDEMESLIAEINRRMPPEERFDGRIYTIFVAHHGWLSNDLLGDRRLTNEEYTDFIRHLVTHVPPPTT